MRRYLLGILAVVVLQIAFTVYMSYNKSDKQTMAANNVNADNEKSASTKRPVPAKSEFPFAVKKGKEIETAKVTDAVEAIPVEPRHYTRPSAPRAEFTAARSTETVAPRRSIFRSRPPVERASVERQYFGRMVVERTFWPAKTRPNRSTAIVKRQTFGRMVVERTSGV